MNDDSIDAIKYALYQKKYDEISKETESFGRAQFIDKIIGLHGDILALLLEKDKLIKYLEDEIKKCDEDIEATKKWLDEKELFNQVQNNLRIVKSIRRTYQEILDKVKKGKYE